VWGGEGGGGGLERTRGGGGGGGGVPRNPKIQYIYNQLVIGPKWAAFWAIGPSFAEAGSVV
jgi:hypothetical protein